MLIAQRNIDIGMFYIILCEQMKYFGIDNKILTPYTIPRICNLCKSENQYTDKWEIEKKNILFFWNKKCECILKPMRFSRLVKCGRIHIENTNERLSR